MNKIQLIFVLILALWSTWPAKAQDQNFRFDHLTNDDGLANTQVQTLLQDSKGFIWIGTLGGLHRYDGYDFSVFRHSHNDTTSLADNSILTMCEDSEGHLWLGTREGLICYNSRLDQFHSYTSGFGNANWLRDKSIRAIAEDHNGGLWIAVSGEGLIRFDKKTNQFAERFMFDEKNNDPQRTLMSNHIKSIAVDKHSNLWLATDNGLTFFNTSSKTFYTYLPGKDRNTSLPDRFVKALCFDRQGKLWIGTDGGLCVATISNDKILSYTSFFEKKNDPHTISSNLIKALIEDKEGKMWIASDLGVNIYDDETKVFIALQNDPNNHQSIGSNYCRHLLQDKQGIIWVATDRGVSKYDPDAFPFHTFSHNPKSLESLSSNYVNAMEVDKKGRYWIGTDNGLNRYDPSIHKFSLVSSVQAKVSSTYITTIKSDKSGKLWLGTDKGLYLYDPESDRVSSFFYNPRNDVSGYAGGVLSLWINENDILFVGTWDGIYVFDEDKKSFKRYLPEIKGKVQTMLRDASGSFWIGTREQLIRVSDPASKKPTLEIFQHEPTNPTSISFNNITILFEASDGILWIGTGGGGLNYYDEHGHRFQNYTWDSGLPSDNIYGIQEDSRHNLWISTDKGLCRLNPSTKKITTYGKEDGLPSDAFNIGSTLKTSSGELFFGSVNGISAFKPEAVVTNEFSPSVYITDFWLAGKLIKPGSVGVLPEAIQYLTSITLTPDEKVFSLGFVALNYRNPSKNLFSYKMENFDEEWSNTDSDVRFATYTNLPPGTYIFRVRASNNDGIWSKNEARLTIHVLPPFWATWWFYSLVILFILSVVYAIFKIRMATLRKGKMKLREEVALRTMELQSEKENLEKANRQITVQRDEIEAQKEKIEADQIKLKQAQQVVMEQNLRLQTYNVQLENNVAVRTSELQATMEKMVRANNELDLFVYRAAHDLRGPIARLQGLCQVGQMEPDKQVAFQYLNKINAVSQEMSAMLTRLLRARALNKQELMPVTISLHQTVDAVVNRLKQEEKVFDIDIKIVIDHALSLYVDVELFEILLQNVIQNAIRYRDVSCVSYIRIEAKRDAEHVTLCVEDNGIGIPNGLGDRVFEMFFKGTDKSSGFGLGLYESRLITNRLNGKIDLIAGEGKTQVIIVLPVN